jgi:hypothetical protein
MPQKQKQKEQEQESKQEQEEEETRTRQRVVFYAENKPDSLEIIDRFNIYYVTSLKHRNKSEALKHLLKIALDIEEKKQQEQKHQKQDPGYFKGDEADDV